MSGFVAIDAKAHAQRVGLAHREAVRLHLPYLRRLQPHVRLLCLIARIYAPDLRIRVQGVHVERLDLIVHPLELLLTEARTQSAHRVEALQCATVGGHEVGAEETRAGALAVKAAYRDQV